jgi:hypothetical protein
MHMSRCTTAPVLLRVTYRQPVSRPHICRHCLHWRAWSSPPAVVVAALLCNSSSPPAPPQWCQAPARMCRTKRCTRRDVGGGAWPSPSPPVTHASLSGTEAAHCPQAPPPFVTHVYLLIECRWSRQNPAAAMVVAASYWTETRRRRLRGGEEHDGCDFSWGAGERRGDWIKRKPPTLMMSGEEKESIQFRWWKICFDFV